MVGEDKMSAFISAGYVLVSCMPCFPIHARHILHLYSPEFWWTCCNTKERSKTSKAILPLRGKILNVERRDEAAMYKNEEIQNLILGLGLGVKGEDFRKDALRYHKIIILTDADVDGAHIRTLLLTFFFRYQKALFEEGCIYVGVPPLYKVERGKQVHYCHDDNELNQPAVFKYIVQTDFIIALQILSVCCGEGACLKWCDHSWLLICTGLGEMMPTQLWETTLDPATRMLKQLTVEDAAEANVVFSLLMGNRVEPRKELIQSSASKMSLNNLDV
eukprot:Gb_13262 [translate_table: standard]